MNKSDYDKYYKKGGTYVIPIEIFNELFDELERLNNLVKGLREERDYLFNKTTTESNYEIERLNNIINEFDKWLENEIKFQEIVENAHFLRKARIKLQELKGSDSNE